MGRTRHFHKGCTSPDWNRQEVQTFAGIEHGAGQGRAGQGRAGQGDTAGRAEMQDLCPVQVLSVR